MKMSTNAMIFEQNQFVHEKLRKIKAILINVTQTKIKT